MQTRSRSVKSLGFADEIAVVEDVVVGQRGALGRASGAAGELDVDRIVELQRGGELGELRAMALAAHCEHVGETQKAALLVVADPNERPQRGQAL